MVYLSLENTAGRCSVYFLLVTPDPASPVPEADLPSLLLSGALILHLAICQEEADAEGWRLRRVR